MVLVMLDRRGRRGGRPDFHGPAGGGTGRQADAASRQAAPDSGNTASAPRTYSQISVWRNEAMSRTVPVRPDGRISLPLLNDVEAGGLTPAELRESLIKKLAEYMPNPEVSVIVLEARSFKVSVIGEVPRPGRFELKSWTTVLDVLAMAGGFNAVRRPLEDLVMRPEGKGHEADTVQLQQGGGLAGEQENFYLRAGDIVVVP